MPTPDGQYEPQYRIKAAVTQGKAYLCVQEPPEAAAITGSFPAQDTNEHEHEEYEIRDECAEDRNSVVQAMINLAKGTNPMSAKRGHT
jgi:hypothetical protein